MQPHRFLIYHAIHPASAKPLGPEGLRFQAVLKEFATILVTKPEGCSLIHGPFALTQSGALHKIMMRTWRARLTWTAHREHANQFVRGMQSLYDSFAFMMMWGGDVAQKEVD